MRLFKRVLDWIGRAAPRRLKRHAYAAAISHRLSADWIFAPLLSADQEVQGSAPILRARARELVRNNSWAARYLDLVTENVIGHEGIQLQAHVTSEVRGEKRLATEVNDEIERAWREWGRPGNACVDRRSSWQDVQELVVQSLAQDGEYLIRIVSAFDNDFGFALQVLDPDQIDTTLNEAPAPGVHEIRMGIELDRWGAPVAYWIWTEHPSKVGGLEKERVRIPADEIIHGFVRRRPGQTRGVTWFAPVMQDMKMLQGYQEAELVAARTAAAKMGWFRKNELFPDLSPDAREEEQRRTSEFQVDAEPGTFGVLPMGLEFQAWDPQHPTTSFSAFLKQILRSVSSGLGTAFASLSNDLTDVNFSSIRAGILIERDHWRRLQRLVYSHLHDRVYREWIRHAILAGAVRLPTRRPQDYHQVVWQPRGWPWVDPLKDAQAAALQIRLGTNSRTRLAAEQGRDFEDVLADLAMEQEAADRFGVTLTTDTSKQGGDDDGERGQATVTDIREWVRNRRIGRVPRDGYPGGPGGPGQPSRNGNGRRADPDRTLIGAPR